MDGLFRVVDFPGGRISRKYQRHMHDIHLIRFDLSYIKITSKSHHTLKNEERTKEEYFNSCGSLLLHHPLLLQLFIDAI